MIQIFIQWTLSTTGRRYLWNDVGYEIYFLFLKWTQLQTTINNEVPQCSLLSNARNFPMYDYSKEWMSSNYSFLIPDQGHEKERRSNPRKSIHSTSTQIKLSMKIKVKNDKKVFLQMQMKKWLPNRQTIQNM